MAASSTPLDQQALSTPKSANSIQLFLQSNANELLPTTDLASQVLALPTEEEIRATLEEERKERIRVRALANI